MKLYIDPSVVSIDIPDDVPAILVLRWLASQGLRLTAAGDGQISLKVVRDDRAAPDHQQGDLH